MWLNELVAAHLPGELKFTPLKHSGMIVMSHEQWSTGQGLVEHVRTCFRSTVVSRVVSGGRPWCYLLRFWATRTMCTPCSPKYRGDFPAIPPSSSVDPSLLFSVGVDHNGVIYAALQICLPSNTFHPYRIRTQALCIQNQCHVKCHLKLSLNPARAKRRMWVS